MVVKTQNIDALASWALPESALTLTVASSAPTPVHHCSCGLGFIKLAALDDHLDRYGEHTDAHPEIGLKRTELLARGLRGVRRELGLTMRDMAALLGMVASTISRIVSERRGASRWKPSDV